MLYMYLHSAEGGMLVQKGQYIKIYLYTSRFTYIHQDLFIYIKTYLYIHQNLLICTKMYLYTSQFIYIYQDLGKSNWWSIINAAF